MAGYGAKLVFHGQSSKQKDKSHLFISAAALDYQNDIEADW